METIKDDCVLLLDEVIAWIGERARFAPSYDLRLTHSEWRHAQELAASDEAIAERVALLRSVPQSQVLLPDSY